MGDASRRAPTRARRRRATASLSKRSVGVPMRRSRQARRPAKSMAAGIDAASMARRGQSPFKYGDGFSPPAQLLARQGGQGLGSQGTGTSRVEAPGPPTTPLNAANVASARSRSKLRNPRNPSRPGEDSGARERRAKPLPTLPHTEAVASAKRRRHKRHKRRRRRRHGRGGSCDFAQDDRQAQRRSVAQIRGSLRSRRRSSQPALRPPTKLR